MKCSKCEKEFSYKLVGNVYPGAKGKEDIICPYCNHICGSIMTSQTIETVMDDVKSNVSKSSKNLLTEQETEMMDSMTEGQLAEYLAENLSDY